MICHDVVDSLKLLQCARELFLLASNVLLKLAHLQRRLPYRGRRFYMPAVILNWSS